MLTFPVGEDMAVFVKPLVISIQSLLSPLDAQHAREGMGGKKKDGGDWDLFPGVTRSRGEGAQPHIIGAGN